jgi:hypothetical protein
MFSRPSAAANCAPTGRRRRLDRRDRGFAQFERRCAAAANESANPSGL